MLERGHGEGVPRPSPIWGTPRITCKRESACRESPHTHTSLHISYTICHQLYYIHTPSLLLSLLLDGASPLLCFRSTDSVPCTLRSLPSASRAPQPELNAAVPHTTSEMPPNTSRSPSVAPAHPLHLTSAASGDSLQSFAPRATSPSATDAPLTLPADASPLPSLSLAHAAPLPLVLLHALAAPLCTPDPAPASPSPAELAPHPSPQPLSSPHASCTASLVAAR